MLDVPRMRGNHGVRNSEKMFGGDSGHFKSIEVQVLDLANDLLHRIPNFVNFPVRRRTLP